MLRNLLEREGINLTKEEFDVVMEITTDDIKFNHLRFNKKIKLNEIIAIACRCAQVFAKCA